MKAEFLQRCKEYLIKKGKSEEEAEAFIFSIFDVKKKGKNIFEVQYKNGETDFSTKRGERISSLVEKFA